MGTTLEGKQINQTYQGLLKTTDNNEVGASAKEITDGKGNGTGVTLDNSGNLTATNVTATSFIGDGSQLTNLPVTSVNTQTGSVVLDADDISDTTTTNKFTTASDISKLANIEDNADVTDVTNVTTALNSISATELSDITSVGSGSIITSVERTKLSGIEANAEVNPTNAEIKTAYESNANTNAFTDAFQSKLQNIEAGAEVNDINSVNGQVGTVSLDTDDINEGTANKYYTEARVSANTSVVANTAKVSFPEAPNDGDAYVRRNQAWESLTHPTDLVTSVNSQTGAVALDTDDIDEGLTNKYYTDARVASNSAVAANTAKVGITTQQAADIVTNNAKVGITTEQANAITANTAKVGITTAQANAIVANTAKNSYPSADATKVGYISVTQAVDLDTLESDVAANNAKVGITTQQASDITANNAKISFDSASSTKLAGIEAGAEVNPTASEIKTSYESNVDTNAFTDAEKTKLSGIASGAEVNVNADWNAVSGDAQILNKPTLATVATTGSYNDLSDQPTIPTNNNELTNGAGYITDGNTNWDNTYGFITATSTDTLLNKSGNISQWTNDTGYTTNIGDITSVTAGTNLTGGGTSGDVTLNMATGGIGSGTYGSTADGTKIDTITVDAYGRVTAVATGVTGDITNISVGTGLDGGGSTGSITITLDLSELTDMTADLVGTDEFIVLDGGTQSRKAANEISTSVFNTEIQSNAIGHAIDFSSRVTLTGGVAEGTSGIIKNLQSIL